MDPIQHLRSVLDAALYRADVVAERLGVDTNLSIRFADVPVHLRRLSTPGPLNSLIRLFLLDSPVSVEEAEGVLGEAGLHDLQAARVLRRDETSIRSCLRLMPYEGLLFAYDRHDPDGLRRDSVLGWTSSARTLASMTVRRTVDSALDLGTGCGVQALLAARHTKRVVAVDLNPRALWLTELNCRLNGISNVECRQGDLFAPVAGETFDLVVSNPPFVISPSRDYLFRDSGFEGDGLSRAAVSGAAAILRDGGFSHVMCNWIVGHDEPWWAAPSAWVEGSGCDALLLHYDTLDPLRYAAGWNDYVASDADRFGATLDEWLDYYRRHGIEAIGMGAVILRRRAGDGHWIRSAEHRRGPSGSSSEQVQRLFAAQDLRGTWEDDRFLLEQPLRVVDRHRIEQTLTFRERRYTADAAVIVLDEGLGLRNSVDPQALHVVLRMDGSHTVRQLLSDVAEETGLDAEVLAPSVLECVRELFELGFLELGQEG